MEYFEEIQDRVILIGVQADRGDDMEESLDELGELAATAGAAGDGFWTGGCVFERGERDRLCGA